MNPPANVMHLRENRCFSKSASSSSNSALVHAKNEKKPPKGRPFFPSGVPQPAANPGGVLAPER